MKRNCLKVQVKCHLAEFNPCHNTKEGIKMYCNGLGIAVQTYNKYVEGKMFPRLNRALLIASIIGRPLEQIWTIEDLPEVLHL